MAAAEELGFRVQGSGLAGQGASWQCLRWGSVPAGSARVGVGRQLAESEMGLIASWPCGRWQHLPNRVPPAVSHLCEETTTNQPYWQMGRWDRCNFIVIVACGTVSSDCQ